MSSRHTLPATGTLPVAADPAPGSGQVLIIHPDRGVAADIAGELAAAGWLTAAASAVDNAPSAPRAVLIIDATDHGAGDAARIARIRQSMPGAPVLFLTTGESFAGLLAGGPRPGDDYLIAPFTPGDVAMRLRWLTRDASTVPRDPELIVGDLTLRPRWLLARRCGRQIPLTKTQCAVLQLLMENPGTVMRKDEIANHVWPGNPARGGSNVELYISYLRRKINPAGPPMIHTLRGIGYLIKPAPTAQESAALDT